MPEATHHVEHTTSGKSADIYIAPSQLLNARSGSVSHRDSICIAFRKTVEKAENIDLGRVFWHRLDIKVLPSAPIPPEPATMGRHL